MDETHRGSGIPRCVSSCCRDREPSCCNLIHARSGHLRPAIEARDLTILPPELFPKESACVIHGDGKRRASDVVPWGWPRTVPARTGCAGHRVANIRDDDVPF